MSKIVIGKTGRKKATIDVGKLLRTRLLIQANSGGGKSWLIRRLAEQLFGKVQVIIIDPEGEFATLREKFGYVLVGEGGEAAAHPRSAALLATKLLELRSSAVCDLYEMKASERHRWVRLFLDAMVNANKKLWHPVVVVVDEAHNFCPEKGAGESEASDAMIGLATKGRKRGFCAVFATQRLGKLRKDAAAELLNIMVGMTFIDVDRKRAAEALGISDKKKRDKFFDSVKVMEAGNFYALGRAISKERILIKVGSVQTTHPEPGSTRFSAKPPPAPSKVKKLLPKLADLPQEAEEKAKTEADLRKEIRSLKAELRLAPKLKTPAKMGLPSKIVESIDRAAIKKNTKKAIGEAIARFEIEVQKLWTARVNAMKAQTQKAWKALEKSIFDGSWKRSKFYRFELPEISTKKIAAGSVHAPAPVRKREIVTAPASNGNVNVEGLSKKQEGILRALSEFDAIGKDVVPRTWIAVRAGCSSKSSGFSNNLSALKTRGLIEYRPGKEISFSPEGREATPECEQPLTPEEALESCKKLLSVKQGAILQTLYEAHPEHLSRDEVAERADCSPLSSGYSNNLSALRTAGMIEYGAEKTLKCADWIFVE
jgi:ParB-like chromosome segregation protein Spo0J